LLLAVALTGVFIIASADDDITPADPAQEDGCCCGGEVDGCTGDCTDCDTSECDEVHSDCTCCHPDDGGCGCGGETDGCTGDCDDCDASGCDEANPGCGGDCSGEELPVETGHCGGCH